MKRALVIALLLGNAALFGCGKVGGTQNDLAPGAGDGSNSQLNGCTTYKDQTAGGGAITFPMVGAPMQYSPACVHIKAGQSVTWTGAFASHPLQPEGGAVPNPVTSVQTGMTTTILFPTAGVYGYGCGIHGSMIGAIQVTP